MRLSAPFARFTEPGWSYERVVATPCPTCGGELHTLRKPYMSAGKQYRYVAIVCPRCPAAFDLAGVGVKKYDHLLTPPRRAAADGPPRATALKTVVDDAVAAANDSTISDLTERLWGVRPTSASPHFDRPGWWHEGPSPRPCPDCGEPLQAFRKNYDGPNRKPGTKPGHLVAAVCPACPATFQLRTLGLRTYAHLMTPPESETTKPVSRPNSTPWLDCDVEPGGMRIRTIHVADVEAYVAELLGQPGARVVASSPVPLLVETRLLHWVKTTNPHATIPRQPPHTDVRVLLPLAPEFEPLASRLAQADVAFRQVRYWLEDETISTVGEGARLAPLRATAAVSTLVNGIGSDPVTVRGVDAAAARDAFEMIWQAHDETVSTVWTPVAAAEFVPVDWLPYLPYPTLNPAQAQTAPVIADESGHVVVTAPTGAGKTVIGMLAAIKAIVTQGRKAAWLVPQRSLTDELDRELEAWRGLGVRVERLSGEQVTDLRKIRDADLWISTTEKFESLCRTASMRTALAEVACLVVDEIHLLGDPVRGPLLEALLARVRGTDSPVRIVGLSATVSNATEIADWLGAHLVATVWRPSRLTWQLPAIPGSHTRTVEHSQRNQLAVAITAQVTEHAGSVLVFCGSKRNVRATALAIATARGANTAGVHVDDLDALERVCTSVRVGLHYRDWDHKAAAERAFRARDLDVLVATTTVAAGVNLPARAVIVRDTQLGTTTMGVATVQQMFGRAGRVGAGETEGWSYLITTEGERPDWQAKLVAGYTVVSHIANTLPDHLLAEAAQDRLHTVSDAEHWWISTLAHHQGTRDVGPVHAALQLLIDGGYLTETIRDDTTLLTVTDLGYLTTRLMVSVHAGIELTAHLSALDHPAGPEQAEALLARTVATTVPQFAEAPVPDELRPTIARLLRAGGNPAALDTTPPAPGLAPADACAPGDLAQLAFLLVAHAPHSFAGRNRTIAGLTATTLFPILAEAPRYFSWLAEQGPLGTVHPWIAITAADLGRRIRWRTTAPPRGSGRLLWMCEQMATREHADQLVPQLYRSARNADITSPDWPSGQPPRQCRLDHNAYLTLLRDRTTGTTISDHPDGTITIQHPDSGIVTLWSDNGFQPHPTISQHDYRFPEIPEDPTVRGAAIFTRRGDYHVHGWGTEYNQISG
ncbi:DEAD/DEAH box helicase [Kutzneria sp. CA-103260]|uniref:DEAD/DEAH box helicase n=1 Tax=Kutzneria sp. CA-103260 TaxID=2802641 RepID=UPI001BAB78FC|nr:DEAD/DEAH box helicase [Kutzneria sp. CA-103260]